jgi:predicted signal transduction protein with EAL and GGDEF domain
VNATARSIADRMTTDAAEGRAVPCRLVTAPQPALSNGDYSQKAEAGRPDEIGDFADSFNHMLEGIFERESKILRLAYEDTLTGLPNRAMYVAKRNNTSFTTYEPEFEQSKASQSSLLGELRSAVEEDQLTLYYQPKVDLHSGASDSVEALVRWVLERALRQCGDWHLRGLDVKISINMSARAQETLERLHKLGVRLSIDDFGTGHSSLAYIRKLPVQEMKIDRSFVRNMVADKLTESGFIGDRKT